MGNLVWRCSHSPGKMKIEIHGNEDNMSTYLLCNRVKTEVAARGPPTLVYLGGLRMHMW